MADFDRVVLAHEILDTMGVEVGDLQLLDVVRRVMDEAYEDSVAEGHTSESTLHSQMRDGFNTLSENGGVDYDTAVGELFYSTVRDATYNSLQSAGFIEE